MPNLTIWMQTHVLEGISWGSFVVCLPREHVEDVCKDSRLPCLCHRFHHILKLLLTLACLEMIVYDSLIRAIMYQVFGMMLQPEAELRVLLRKLEPKVRIKNPDTTERMVDLLRIDFKRPSLSARPVGAMAFLFMMENKSCCFKVQSSLPSRRWEARRNWRRWLFYIDHFCWRSSSLQLNVLRFDLHYAAQSSAFWFCNLHHQRQPACIYTRRPSIYTSSFYKKITVWLDPGVENCLQLEKDYAVLVMDSN